VQVRAGRYQPRQGACAVLWRCNLAACACVCISR
jgi:hypothetical protein